MSSSTSPPFVVPAAYIRGGTSKAVFFHEKDLPPAGKLRDDFMIRMMGSPDPSQIDGMGGTRVVTSKAAIIRPSKREDADVDYTFVQVGLGESTVAYDGNCGNISSGVGPFAINEGLVEPPKSSEETTKTVRIYNTGMDFLLIAHVPINPTNGRALEKGDYQISGCPGTGAPILMDYSKTAKPTVLLPTGNVVDHLDCTFGAVEASYCSVANPIVFVKADSLGARGDEKPPELDSNTALLGRIREVRGRIAQKVGRCEDWSKVDEQSPMLPMIALVSKPTSEDGSIQSRLFLDNHCHPSMAGTGAVCTTALAHVRGSVPNQVARQGSDDKVFVIQHPLGSIPISIAATYKNGEALPTFQTLGFTRTARYLMQGSLYVPEDMQDSWAEWTKTTTAATQVGPDERAKNAHDEQAVAHPAATSTEPAEPVEVTQRFVDFVHSVKYEDLSTEALTRVRQCLLDFLGVGLTGARVGESSPAFVQGIDSICKDLPGSTAVFGTSRRYPTQYAALLNSAFGHTLDFDDTHSGGIIHVAVSVISSALAESQNHPDLQFRDFLVAVAAGYEVAVRIAISLGVSSWHRGFHNTSIAGIFGAVTAISKLRGVDTTVLGNAFGLACSFASGSMQYLENGAWNKRLHPAKAAHDAFLILAFAQAHVLGASKPIEGKLGLIAAHTDGTPIPVDVSDLGKRWELTNTGLKPYPGCRATHPAIELAAILGKEGASRSVESIHICMDNSTYPVTGLPAANKIHPTSVVDAQFSSYYQAAACYLYGDQLGWAIYDHIEDPAVHDLLDKVTIEGKAMSKNLCTSMKVTWTDGQSEEKTLEDPKWEEPERPAKDEEVAQKFLSLATTSLGAENAGSVVKFVTGSPDQSVAELVTLLRTE